MNYMPVRIMYIMLNKICRNLPIYDAGYSALLLSLLFFTTVNSPSVTKATYSP